MLRGRHAAISMSLLILASPRANSQDQNDVASLRKALQAQQALNQKLLERLEAVETAQATLLEKFQTLEASVPNTEEFRKERDAMLEGMSDEYFDLQDRLDSLPTISGYYDFEYFNDNREDSPDEFRHHHLSLHLSQEWEKWRLFSEIEFEFGTKFEGDGGDELEQARGEVKLEQSWGEYVHSDALTLRGGLILTPGYWNVNHYPPTHQRRLEPPGWEDRYHTGEGPYWLQPTMAYLLAWFAEDERSGTNQHDSKHT